MSQGLNKVMLLGNIGMEPDLKYGQNGNAVLRLRLATNETWKDRQTGQRQERTEWHTVIFFGNRAEGLSKVLTKGAQVFVEGSLQTRQWEDRDGNKRYTTEVRGRDLVFAGGSREGGGGRRQTEHREERHGPGGTGGHAANFPADDFSDDDLPF